MRALTAIAFAACATALAGDVVVNNSSNTTNVAIDGGTVNSGINLGGSTTPIQGSGKQKTERRELQGFFSRIETAGISSVEIDCAPGESPSIELKADENLLGIIDSKISGKTLTVRPLSPMGITTPISVKIRGAKGLSSFVAAGSGSLKMENLDAKAFSVSLLGDWKASLQGSCEELNAGFSGKGQIDAYALKAGTASVKARGSGEMRLQTDNVSVDLAGPVAVLCKGSPQIKSPPILGGGGRFETGK